MRPVHRFTTALTLLYLLSLSAANTVLIDNADSRVQYGGQWTLQGSATADDYMSTLAYSEWNSATAMLEFTGTSVAVFGTLKPAGTWNIHSAYSVDGAEMTAYVNLNPLSGEQHHVQFFSQSGLSDGTHTLTIENMGQQFWFDYVAVETAGVGGGLPPAIPSTIPTPSSVIASSTTPHQTPSSTSIASVPPSSTLTTSTVHPVTSPSHSTITSPPSSTTSDSTTITTTGSSTSDSDIPSGTSTATSAQTTTGQSSPSSAGQPSTETSSRPTVASSPGSHTTSQPGSTTSGVSPTLILGSSSEHERRGLSPGEIAGIAVGGAVALVVLLAALCVGCRRHRRLKARRVVTPFVTPPRAAEMEDSNGNDDDDTVPLWTWPTSEKATSAAAATAGLHPLRDPAAAHRAGSLPTLRSAPLALPFPGAALLRNPSQTERSSAPPTVRGRVLLINRAAEGDAGGNGGGMWADYSSSAPTHSVSLGPRSSAATSRPALRVLNGAGSEVGSGGGGGGGLGARFSGGTVRPAGRVPMSVHWLTPDSRPPRWI